MSLCNPFTHSVVIDDTPYVNQALSAILLGQTEAGP